MPRSVYKNASTGPGCGRPLTPRSLKSKAGRPISRKLKSLSGPCAVKTNGSSPPRPRSNLLGNFAIPPASLVAAASSPLLRGIEPHCDTAQRLAVGERADIDRQPFRALIRRQTEIGDEN